MHLVFKILLNLIWLKHFENVHRSPACFGCYFSTIIREPQSSAKVTYVRCIYGDNGVVTADKGRTGHNISRNISHIKRRPLCRYSSRAD